MRVKCSDCGREVPDTTAWRGVQGFEQRRAKGGTNHVALRAPTGEWLCDGCMRSRQLHVNRGQTGMEF